MYNCSQGKCCSHDAKSKKSSHHCCESSHGCGCGCENCCCESSCGAGSCCESSSHSCGHGYHMKAEKLLEIANMAWAEVLKEKIKEHIKNSDSKIDQLAKIVAEANHQRWKHKMEKEKCYAEHEVCCEDFEDQLYELFSCCDDSCSDGSCSTDKYK